MFSSFEDMLLEDVPFFILLDIMDCCEFYIEHYKKSKKNMKKTAFNNTFKRT